MQGGSTLNSDTAVKKCKQEGSARDTDVVAMRLCIAVYGTKQPVTSHGCAHRKGVTLGASL